VVRCKSCHYSLANLTERRCPECGREFDPSDPRTFSTPKTVNDILNGRTASIVMMTIAAIIMIALTTCLIRAVWLVLIDD